MRFIPQHPALLPVKRLYWRLLSMLGLTASVDIITPGDAFDAIARKLPTTGPKPVIVDGGAFDGRTSLALLKKFPGAQVHAFEPVEQTYQTLVANVAKHGVMTHPLALSDTSGTVAMNITAQKMSCSAMPPGEESDRFVRQLQLEGLQTARSTSIDDWARKKHIDQIDLLKLDLQGYELHALRGAEDMLTRGIACIYVEVNFVAAYAGAPTLTDIDLFLRQRGYRLFNLYNLHTFRADGRLSGCDALFVPAQHQTTGLRRAA